MFFRKHLDVFGEMCTSFFERYILQGVDAFEEYVQALQSYIHKTGGLTSDSDTELE